MTIIGRLRSALASARRDHNAGPKRAINLLLNHAARPMSEYLAIRRRDLQVRETTGMYGSNQLREAGDVVRDHAAALRDLGLSIDDIVQQLTNRVMILRTHPDPDGLVVSPEPHEVEQAVRHVLARLNEVPWGTDAR